MAIAVVCQNCGKNLKVPDDRAGKLAKCPGCMTTFTVPGGGGAGHAAAAIAAGVPKTVGPGMQIKKPEPAVPGFTVAWGSIFLIVGLLLIPLSVAAIYFGPVRTKHKWDAVADQAYTDVQDIVTRGMQSHESHSAFFNPKKSHFNADVRDITFIAPLGFSMPESVEFKGMTSQGAFKGQYFVKTGEVVADVDMGGMTIAGLDKPVHKGSETIKITGRRKDGQVIAEVDGKNADIVTAKPGKDDSE